MCCFDSHGEIIMFSLIRSIIKWSAKKPISLSLRTNVGNHSFICTFNVQLLFRSNENDFQFSSAFFHFFFFEWKKFWFHSHLEIFEKFIKIKKKKLKSKLNVRQTDKLGNEIKRLHWNLVDTGNTREHKFWTGKRRKPFTRTHVKHWTFKLKRTAQAAVCFEYIFFVFWLLCPFRIF